MPELDGHVRVDEIVLREIAIAMIRPFRTSRVVTTRRRIGLLEFRRAGETLAWSECVAGEAPDYTGETIDTAWHALTTWLLPAVVGRPFSRPVDVERAMSQVRDHRMARASIEMGFQAMAAHAEDLSLARYLGGARERVPTGASLGLDDDFDRLAERAAAAASDGYARVKVKIEPGRDYEPLGRVRAAIGDLPMAADANGAYPIDPTQALERLDDHSLQLLEQPFAPRNFPAHAALQRRMRTSLCLDESIEAPDDAEVMNELSAARVINIKPGRVGGLGAAARLHDYCVSRDIPVLCGGMFETGLGRAYNLALAALPGFTIAGDLYPASTYLETDIVAERSVVEQGGIEVPVAPGVGVAVDVERVSELAVRTVRVRA